MKEKFEFRFVVVLARHAEDPSGVDDEDVGLLNDLGQDGWQIAGVTPDPLMPAARLIVSLQRPVG